MPFPAQPPQPSHYPRGNRLRTYSPGNPQRPERQAEGVEGSDAGGAAGPQRLGRWNHHRFRTI